MWTLLGILFAVLLFITVGMVLAGQKIERDRFDDYNRRAAAERKLYRDVGNATRIRNIRRQK